MQESFVNFNNFLSRNIIQIQNIRLRKVAEGYKFYIISEKSDYIQDHNIINNLKKSDVIIISQITEKGANDKYFIISFRNTMILINQSLQNILQDILSINTNASICFLSDTEDIFNEKDIKIQNKIIKNDNFFNEEIKNFNYKFIIKSANHNIIPICNAIKLCIGGYLIKQSYAKLNKKQKLNFSSNSKSHQIEKWEVDVEYITLRVLGNGSTFIVQLIYHIENEELYAIKQQYRNQSYLIEREEENYLNFDYPFLPKLYAKDKSKGHLIIQFIDGKSLKNINDIKLDFNEIITIMFELIMTVNYLHKRKFILRDLKPDNVIIDRNKNAFIIDFDRMVKCKDIIDHEMTNDFSSVFAAPEVNTDKISYKSDVYSLGKMIEYIINKTDTKQENLNEIKKIIKRCININFDERPSATELMFEFYLIFSSIIDQNHDFLKEKYVNRFDSILLMSEKYMSNNVEDAIYYLKLAANQNYSDAQFILGYIFIANVYIKRDVNKAIHYYTLAANQNHSEAQYNLGIIYYADEYQKKDINKSIYYFTLAANQNHSEAQYNLGIIYYADEYIQRDINKSIYYFTLAANQNHSRAQYNLGIIYYADEYIQRDINKSIYYFTLAANQNHSRAQLKLGEIFFEEEFIGQNINKAAFYFKLAADQGDCTAQTNLGIIYSDEKYKLIDIDKAIHYFTLAAEQNYPEAHANLGEIYYEGKYVQQDINKAIYYFKLAAAKNNTKALMYLYEYSKDENYLNRSFLYKIHEVLMEGNKDPENLYNLSIFYFSQDNFNEAIRYLTLAADRNHSLAQENLGRLYYEGQYVTRDINKAIFYFERASNQDNVDAQMLISYIYYQGLEVKRDINKVIYYLNRAASKNYPDAIFNLGIIYIEGKYVEQNVKMGINYVTKAANQNLPSAQYYLGQYFFNKKYIKQDINKTIHYMTLAANNNYPDAQYFLGTLYYENQYVAIDIDKSIHYLTLAANQNHSGAQINLGIVYYDGINVIRNVDKAIYYLNLAANSGSSNAQRILGIYYLQGKFIKQDIDKAIHYLTLAANQNDEFASYDLYEIYLSDEYGKKDEQKALHYMKLALKSNNLKAQLIYGLKKVLFKNDIKSIQLIFAAAKSNYCVAQYALGFLYFTGTFVKKNINVAIDYFNQSSINGLYVGHFTIGFFYHEGKHLSKDIKRSIHYYKMASSYNEQHAKNNLGVIYKHEHGEGNEKNIGLAMSYFEEAINQSDDKLSIYNLAHIYLFIDKTKESISKSINLLLRIIEIKGLPVKKLLCIATYNDNNLFQKLNHKLRSQISKIKNRYDLKSRKKYRKFYRHYKNVDFIYDFGFNYLVLEEQQKQTPMTAQNITSDFYDGFGI